MAEASAAGIPPWRFWDMTYRELYAVFVGRNIQQRREYRLGLWVAWNAGNYSRAKKMPSLQEALQKLEPKKKMSTRQLRTQILGLAESMGAKVTKVPKGKFSMFAPKPKS